jgi:hypothetical protein
MDIISEEQLKVEIAHIFDSGANEIRILEMVKSFIDRRNVVNKISSNPMLADRLPNAEDVKRWYQLLVGKSEEAMQKDIEATLR